MCIPTRCYDTLSIINATSRISKCAVNSIVLAHISMSLYHFLCLYRRDETMMKMKKALNTHSALFFSLSFKYSLVVGRCRRFCCCSMLFTVWFIVAYCFYSFPRKKNEKKFGKQNVKKIYRKIVCAIFWLRFTK